MRALAVILAALTLSSWGTSASAALVTVGPCTATSQVTISTITQNLTGSNNVQPPLIYTPCDQPPPPGRPALVGLFGPKGQVITSLQANEPVSEWFAALAHPSTLVQVTVQGGNGGDDGPAVGIFDASGDLISQCDVPLVGFPVGCADMLPNNVYQFTFSAPGIRYVAEGFAVSSSVASMTFSVPEPATLGVLGLGLAGIGAARWRKRRAS